MSASAAGGEHPDIRISDADRERVVELLRTHTADGRITLDEFSERVGQAYAARTRGDLDRLTSDLPVPRPAVPPAAQLPAQPASGRAKWVVACMSSAVRRGAWSPGDKVNAVAVMGSCEIDLREARLEGGTVRISAVAIMGGVEIYVAPGTRVEFSGFPLMGGTECRVPDVAPDEATAVVRVSAFALMGGVEVKVKSPRALRGERRGGSRGAADGRPASRSADNGRRPGAPVEGGGAGPAGALPATGTVTVLFSDIAGFTALTERLGDASAHGLVRRHAEVVREQVQACGGYEVNSAGDGFMIAFSSARQAVRCAIAVQRALVGWTAADGAPVRVRMGLHTGDAINDADDFFGLTVNVASRIAGCADGGEVLVSSVTRSLVGNMGDVHFGDERVVALRGVSGEHRVQAVDWAGAGATP